MFISELLDPNTQLKMIIEEEETMQTNLSSPEEQSIVEMPLDKKRRKRKPKGFEETLERLNEIINKTMIDHGEEENEILFELMMHHAEQLKTLSIELLGTEGKVRALKSLESSVLEQYQLRERAYQQRIEECEQVSRQQVELIDGLIELCHDLEPNDKRRSFMTATTLHDDSVFPKQDKKFYVNKTEWDDQQLRYKLSVWMGGSMGSGDLVHSFDNQAGVKEFIISGSGVIFSVRYHYMFHINQDLRDLFKLLPIRLWIPDEQVDQCQLEGCSTRFSFMDRKHHCRK